MHELELHAIAHDGKITLTLPEAYREPWNEKSLKILVLPANEIPNATISTEDFNPLKDSILFESDIVSPIDDA